ncbi:MAG TPA: chemotaxis protein CheW [bacterium]|nr:chemotaxis protein CheW [bacterium]
MSAGDSVQYCTFRVGGDEFGITAERVQEVLLTQPMTEVPLTHPVLRGLLNLRGEVVSALDLRRRLGQDDFAADAQPINIVVRDRGEMVSLMADEIGDVMELETSLQEPAPASLNPNLRGLITNIFMLKGRLLLIMDLDRLLDLDTAPRAAPAP